MSISAVPQGEMVSQEPWYNLSCQAPQPSLRLPSITYDPFTGLFMDPALTATQPPLVASLCTDFAFRLGSCLQIQGGLACSLHVCSWQFDDAWHVMMHSRTIY